MSRKQVLDRGLSHTAELGISCGCAGCGATFALDAVRSRTLISADQEVPETIAIGPNRRRVGEIGDGEQYDVIAINVVAGRKYAVSLRGNGLDPLSDPLLGVFDQNGARLDFDDDGGSGLSSLLTFEALVTGTYYLTAQSAVASETGGYRVEIWAQPKADQVSDRHSEATPITSGATRGFIDENGDVDIYRIFLEAGKIYTIEMSGGVDYSTDYSNFKSGELDPELTLRGADGTLLAFGADLLEADFSSRMIYSPVESGFYTIEAYSAFGEAGGFILDVLERDKSEYDPLEALRWDDAPNVDFGPDRIGYVYFAAPGETFGELDTRGNPLVGQGWNEFEKGQIMVALGEFEKVLGINYEITTDISQATFRLIKAVIPQAGIFYPQDPIYGSSQGLGVFNPAVNGWSVGQQQSLLPGGLAFRTILHEFGHAHGLAHSHAMVTGGLLVMS